jgi:hypothetical protein
LTHGQGVRFVLLVVMAFTRIFDISRRDRYVGAHAAGGCMSQHDGIGTQPSAISDAARSRLIAMPDHYVQPVE